MLGIVQAINAIVTALGGAVSVTVSSGAITATLSPLLLPPGSHTAITPSDSTNVTATASIGLLCTVAGDLAVRGVTTSSTTVTFPVVAGQYAYGSFSRVMAATTATVVGLAP